MVFSNKRIVCTKFLHRCSGCGRDFWSYSELDSLCEICKSRIRSQVPEEPDYD